jgi:hypothetical protein
MRMNAGANPETPTTKHPTRQAETSDRIATAASPAAITHPLARHVPDLCDAARGHYQDRPITEIHNNFMAC